VIEESFLFYQNFLGIKLHIQFLFINTVENKAKDLISFSKFTNERLSFSFLRKCVLYSNELLKLQEMYYAFFRELLFSEDISELFEPGTLPPQKYCYFFYSYLNSDEERIDLSDKMLKRKLHQKFFSLRICNALLWFLTDCPNSEK